jgi:hypothetical protein
MHHQAIDTLGEGFEVLGYTNAYQGCYAPQQYSTLETLMIKVHTLKLKKVPVIIEIIKHATLPILVHFNIILKSLIVNMQLVKLITY